MPALGGNTLIAFWRFQRFIFPEYTGEQHREAIMTIGKQRNNPRNTAYLVFDRAAVDKGSIAKGAVNFAVAAGTLPGLASAMQQPAANLQQVISDTTRAPAMLWAGAR
ncbi:MAG: hypothetical protein AB1445_11470 [Bacillota bacterium]